MGGRPCAGTLLACFLPSLILGFLACLCLQPAPLVRATPAAGCRAVTLRQQPEFRLQCSILQPASAYPLSLPPQLRGGGRAAGGYPN